MKTFVLFLLCVLSVGCAKKSTVQQEYPSPVSPFDANLYKTCPDDSDDKAFAALYHKFPAYDAVDVFVSTDSDEVWKYRLDQEAQTIDDMREEATKYADVCQRVSYDAVLRWYRERLATARDEATIHTFREEVEKHKRIVEYKKTHPEAK